MNKKYFMADEAVLAGKHIVDEDGTLYTCAELTTNEYNEVEEKCNG